MRAWRAVLASFGASTSLILAGTLALFAVSTVVAFQGWPGVEAKAPRQEAALLAASPASGPHATTHRADAIVVHPAVRRAPVARRAAPKPAPSVVRAPAAPVHAQAIPSAGARGTSGASTAAAAPAPTVEKAPARKQTASAGDPVRTVGQTLDGTVQQTTKSLGDTVAPISPALGNVLDNAGKAVGDTVKNVTETVGTVLDALKPKQQPAP